MTTRTFKIEKAASSIEWVGKKVTGSHNGTIDVSDGVVTLAINSVTPGTGNAYHVEGVLTIKAITHSIEFEATIDSIQGDTLIHNDFVLNIHLSAKAA